MAVLPPLRFTGAKILRDDTLAPGALSVEAGRISQEPQREIDLAGYLILPGIVDLHGDAFERHIAPRPTAPFPIESGLRTCERDAAAHGVTTAWLAQSWSWEGGLRGPDFAEDLMAELAAYRPGALIDMRLQIRLETHIAESPDRLIGAVTRHGIDYVVFNNHLPEALARAANEPHRLAPWAEREGGTQADFAAKLAAAQTQAPNVPRTLLKLTEAFDRLGVRYGSHDDPDGETRERFRMLGARIAEFPTSFAAAAAAKAMGDPVIMGAPNVVRGGSQSGGVAAMSLIARGQCDVLVSDYHYPSLAEAAWVIADTGVLSLPEAWAMISASPARLMGLEDRGRIAPGLRADFVIVNEANRRIEATVSAGRVAHLAGPLAKRLLAQAGDLRVAAE